MEAEKTTNTQQNGEMADTNSEREIQETLVTPESNMKVS
jgi:hypothetical protein